jgi:hypothetical protein
VAPSHAHPDLTTHRSTPATASFQAGHLEGNP